jgi:hypothetical protein
MESLESFASHLIGRTHELPSGVARTAYRERIENALKAKDEGELDSINRELDLETGVPGLY